MLAPNFLPAHLRGLMASKYLNPNFPRSHYPCSIACASVVCFSLQTEFEIQKSKCLGFLIGFEKEKMIKSKQSRMSRRIEFST